MSRRDDRAAGVESGVPERPWYRWYEPGVPRTVDLPERTLGRILRDTAARVPDREAIRFSGRVMTYRELDEAVSRFANALIDLGVQPGDRVALVLPNCPQMVIAYYGGLRAGAIVVPVNPTYVEPELRYQLDDAGARVVVCLSLVFPKVQAIRASLPALEHVIVTNIKEYLPALAQVLFTVARQRREGHAVTLPDDGRTHWLQPLLEGASPRAPEIPVDPEAVAVLQYTAGTTGTPKGVMLTHRNLVANALQSRLWVASVTRPDGSSLVLGVIPLFHIYGQTTAMHYPILTGGTTILLPRFGLKEVLSTIEREKPDFFPGVPAMFAVIASASRASRYDLRSIKACISGSAPLPPDVQTRFEAITGARLVEGYGLTEAGPITHCNPIRGERRIGSIGVPFPGTDAAILDLDAGTRALPPGEIGELAVRGPQVMRGYWRREEETARALRDGWLLTGDIGQMDDDGFFTLVDRRKDMIITGGLNVFPSQVVKVLEEHPKVKEAAAIGVPDPHRGEVVKAYVVLRKGEFATEGEIIEYCRDRMAPFKVPRAVEFRDELPKSLLGKVLLRRLAEEEQARAAGAREN